MLRFESAEAVAVVDPVAGGRLASLEVRGHEVLVDTDADPMRWGSFPMVPFAGRVRRGSFTFEGRSYQLPQNLHPHAIHGYGYTSPWSVIDERTIGFTFAQPWPFAGEAVQAFELTDSSLSTSMRIYAHERQPLMGGWHPWFRRCLASGARGELTFGPARMYELDDDAIPTGALQLPPEGPWDNCFTDLATPPIVRWGNELQLRLSSSTDHWVIFTEPDHAICVEPQTGPPNELNAGPRVIEAGDHLALSFQISW